LKLVRLFPFATFGEGYLNRDRQLVEETSICASISPSNSSIILLYATSVETRRASIMIVLMIISNKNAKGNKQLKVTMT
jgi:hypothetical protein